MPYQIQLRRDTAADWASGNPILAEGEWGLETDTGKLKMGDGSTAWTGLGYSATGNVVGAASVTDENLASYDDITGKLLKDSGLSTTDVASAVSLKHSNSLDHTQGTDVALGAVGTKNPPIDADLALYRDSTAADALVTSTWTQVKAFLKTYYDTLYAAIVTPVSFKTADYTLVIGDAGAFIDMTNAAARTFTIPLEAAVNFPVGTTIAFRRGGAGTLTIAHAGTLDTPVNLLITNQYGVAAVTKIAADHWTLYGDVF